MCYKLVFGGDAGVFLPWFFDNAILEAADLAVRQGLNALQ